ncbi:MAG: hypothetical protein U0234_17615 [Sandaracinus sp.]
MSASDGPAIEGGFTALDRIAVALTTLAVAFLWGAVLVWRPAMAAMFEDFGIAGTSELSLLTRGVLSPAVIAVPVGATIALVGAALAKRRFVQRRLVATALVVALAGTALVTVGLYAPFWQTSAAIR